MRRVKNPPTPANYLSPEVAQLLATARTEIDRHLNDAGVCVCCRQEWPCQRACLAAFTLEAL
jgi:hypothetical protein